MSVVKAKQIGVRLEPDTKAALQRAAEKDHRPVSQLVEKIIIEWLVHAGEPKIKGSRK